MEKSTCQSAINFFIVPLFVIATKRTFFWCIKKCQWKWRTCYGWDRRQSNPNGVGHVKRVLPQIYIFLAVLLGKEVWESGGLLEVENWNKREWL